MVNGQWAMDNGQWVMGNGQWAMGNGDKNDKKFKFLVVLTIHH